MVDARGGGGKNLVFVAFEWLLKVAVLHSIQFATESSKKLTSFLNWKFLQFKEGILYEWPPSAETKYENVA